MIVALMGNPYDVHRRDHARARALAIGLARIDRSLVDVERVQTNIVNCTVDRFADDAGAIVGALRDRGVLAIGRGCKIRFVTHSGVDETAVDAAVDAVARVVEAMPRRNPH